MLLQSSAFLNALLVESNVLTCLSNRRNSVNVLYLLSHVEECGMSMLLRWRFTEFLNYMLLSAKMNMPTNQKRCINETRNLIKYLTHSIRTNSRDSLGFSVARIPSAHVTKYRVVPLFLTRRLCIQTVL